MRLSDVVWPNHRPVLMIAIVHILVKDARKLVVVRRRTDSGAATVIVRHLEPNAFH